MDDKKRNLSEKRWRPDTLISQRKSEHLQIVADHDVAHCGNTLLDNIHLLHQALPELDSDEIDLSLEFFSKKINAPFIITSMTGGAEFAREMNCSFANSAQKEGVAFAVGSQRVMLHHPEVASDFTVRQHIPDGVLLGNIGAVQLSEYPPEVIARLVESIEADGICVHLNVAQELMQKEGHRHFRGLLDKIAYLVDYLEGRVLVKETGAGMSPEMLGKLSSIGVSYIDVSGSGGTSFTKVEMHRAPDMDLRRLAETFADWGVPTAVSVIGARRIFKDRACLVASGGIATGLDAARAIAAGADMVGFARPALYAFLKKGTDGVTALIKCFKQELKTAMLLTGSKNVTALQRATRVYTGELHQWLSAYGWLDEGKQ
ncbi:MAG: type 2 isopentenyl-diphosphate Delta-isomerase [candidate division Zixibacteria bacterium 4484_95]|nr:MAG: type 2 isopentenyl-diphosphate Delta-isomerase [candidate division Zixibacteria bacterium 4484_95]